MTNQANNPSQEQTQGINQINLTPNASEMEEYIKANPIQPSYLRRASFWEDLKEVKPDDIIKAPTLPCARSSLLYAVGGGLTIGLAKFLFTARFRPASPNSIRSACNWAVGSFGFISIISWYLNCKTYF
ncbi:hypothetical protein DSO57_1021829 [Entomophthora muscae]|uniref:Uncharacterized protein n=1 Tax=Entomophthora muscae TaxID=34485 RepID=A0ACC2UP30_9FUNG|nr:hypothetical protein DSO57_1021829 [Entomophthora muscae]